MRFTSSAIAASVISSALAAAPSICDKYTTALLKQDTPANQYTLLTLLVNTAVIGNFTGKGSANPTLPGSLVDVPGILAPATMMGEKVNLLQYFDGSLKSTNNNGKAVAVNFLDGGGATPIIKDPTSSGTMGSAQYTLLTHLYQYFGVLLGCSGVGKTGFPNYAGSNSQAEVHRFMDLSNAEFMYFVSQVGAAAESFGVSAADIKTAAGALDSTFGYRCAPAAVVVPGTAKEPQAICEADDCPEAKSPDCSLYPTEMAPVAVGGAAASSGMSMPTPTGGPFPSSGAPTASATTGAFSGAAAMPTAAAGAFAAAAFAAAFL